MFFIYFLQFSAVCWDTNRQTDGQTDPLIEMQGRVYKSVAHSSIQQLASCYCKLISLSARHLNSYILLLQTRRKTLLATETVRNIYDILALTGFSYSLLSAP